MRVSKQYGIGELFDIIGMEFDSQEKHFSRHCQQMFKFCGYCFGNEEIEGQTCLDAGCGTGTASLYFAKKGAKYVLGIDLSKKSLQVAKNESSKQGVYNTVFSFGDLCSLPFDDQTFDIVYSCGALPYVENVFNSIAELIRVTKGDGRMVLMVLKRTWIDSFYESARIILSKFPWTLKIRFAEFIAFASRQTAHAFLGRRVDFTQGKPLAQTIMEAFFSPVKLQRLNYKDIQSFLENRDLRAFRIKGIKDVDFFSPYTCFVIKAIR